MTAGSGFWRLCDEIVPMAVDWDISSCLGLPCFVQNESESPNRKISVSTQTALVRQSVGVATYVADVLRQSCSMFKAVES